MFVYTRCTYIYIYIYMYSVVPLDGGNKNPFSSRALMKKIYKKKIYIYIIYIYICMCLFLYSSRSYCTTWCTAMPFQLYSSNCLLYFNLFFFSKLKIYSIPNFSAFLRPPKKPAQQVFYCSHNFSISLRGLYIGLIYWEYC